MSSKNRLEMFPKLCGKYRVPIRVIETLALQIQRSQGADVEFDIPELGGKGIWKRDNSVKIGNGFNKELNNRATELCKDIEALLQDDQRREETTFISKLEDTTGLMPASIQPSSKTWWPERYGLKPTFTGTAGSLRFAYFKEKNRLVIQHNLRNRIFDTTGYEISDIKSAKNPGFFNTVIVTQKGNVSIIKLTEVAR